MAISPGQFGGPPIPGRTRIAKANVTTNAVMEQDNFGRFIRHADRCGDELMRILAEKMEERGRAKAPVRTGKLRRSIKAILLNDNREVRLIADAPYAGVMEYGSEPHLIHGVKANFRWKNGSRRFVWFDPRYGPADGMTDGDIDKINSSDRGYVNWSRAHGATVRHPGTKPYKFMEYAFDKTWGEARHIMRQVYR